MSGWSSRSLLQAFHVIRGENLTWCHFKLCATRPFLLTAAISLVSHNTALFPIQGPLSAASFPEKRNDTLSTSKYSSEFISHFLRSPKKASNNYILLSSRLHLIFDVNFLIIHDIYIYSKSRISCHFIIWLLFLPTLCYSNICRKKFVERQETQGIKIKQPSKRTGFAIFIRE